MEPKKKPVKLKRVGVPEGQTRRALRPELGERSEREARINGYILEYLVQEDGAYEDAIKHIVLKNMRKNGEAGFFMDEDLYEFVDIQLQRLHKLKIIREFKIDPKVKSWLSPNSNDRADAITIPELYGWRLLQKYRVGMYYLIGLTKS